VGCAGREGGWKGRESDGWDVGDDKQSLGIAVVGNGMMTAAKRKI
jgi:hypothetical protein